ncbi:MAG: septum formation initiator family protein [Ignavibacteria bacterium]|nr:septum formation initiator family protein [Ignavibacteria bacterium]
MKEDKFLRVIFRYIVSRKRLFLILLFFAFMFGFAIFGKKGLLQRYELEVENRELKEKLKKEQEKTILLEKEINEIKTSDRKIEKIAREKYGMIKEGEEMYKIVVDTTK